MQRLCLLVLSLAVLGISPVNAADPLPWPWTSKKPADPALSVLPKVESVTASADKAIVKLSVKAVAPTTGFSELALTPRIGDPKDRVFAFDIRGRAPQDIGAPAETPVSLDVSFTDAPIGKFDIVEVYSKDNCQAYSLTDQKPVACSAKSVPQ